MKVLLINGSPHEKGSTYTALSECAKTLQECGVETEIAWVGTDPVRGCRGCLGCRKNDGHCIFDDDVCNHLIDLMYAADGLIVGSPVHYAGISGTLKALMDRMFYASFDRMAHKPAAGVVSARRAGTTLALTQINKYFEICQMPVMASMYWPMIHGGNAEDALQDLEGLQTMRVLAKNMAYELECIQAAKEAGINPPQGEEKIRFSFIR